MTEIRLIREFLTRELYFLCIDDDDVITRINVRSKGRFIFTAKNFCDFSCEAADSLAFSVYNVPFALDIGCICHKRCLHAISPLEFFQCQLFM